MPKSKRSSKPKKSYYSKRPMWQWILIYVVIGGLLYAAVYYIAFAKKGKTMYNYGTNTQQNQQYKY